MLAVVNLLGVLAVLAVLGGIVVGVVVSLLQVGFRRAVLPQTAVLGHVARTLSWQDVENLPESELDGSLPWRRNSTGTGPAATPTGRDERPGQTPSTASRRPDRMALTNSS